MLSLIIGLLTIVESGSVLLGIEGKPYHILPWLLRYNILIGFVSLAAGIGFWMEKERAAILAKTILIFHGVVFLSLSLYASAWRDRGREQHRGDAVQDNGFIQSSRNSPLRKTCRQAYLTTTFRHLAMP